jgi:hypothetical protein
MWSKLGWLKCPKLQWSNYNYPIIKICNDPIAFIQTSKFAMIQSHSSKHKNLQWSNRIHPNIKICNDPIAFIQTSKFAMIQSHSSKHQNLQWSNCIHPNIEYCSDPKSHLWLLQTLGNFNIVEMGRTEKKKRELNLLRYLSMLARFLSLKC